MGSRSGSYSQQDIREKRLVAYVVSRDGVEVRVEELRQALRANCRSTWCRASFVSVEELPLTPNGKLDRRALPAPGSHQQMRMNLSIRARRGGNARQEFSRKCWELSMWE